MKKDTAKVFLTGRSQAVRLPKKYRFDCDEVFVAREGDKIVLTPKPRDWDTYFAQASTFSEDYPETIEDFPAEERDSL